MSDLSSIERLKFEALFDMESGYVLDFSNNTFSVFTIENVGIDIFDSKYEYGSNSKANRLRKFWLEEPNEVVGKLLSALLDYWITKKQISEAELSSKEKTLYDGCKKIVIRLNQDSFRRIQENTPSPLQKGRIFISYRRTDSAGYAGRIYDRLAARFGENAIFMDVDTIEGGVDFIKVLEDAVQSCDVLIALVGKQWLSITDKDGKRRLDSPEDFVRIEIAVALKRNIRVIPVLVDDVDMPQPIELPESLKALARRNALQVNHRSFNPDVYRLIEHLESALDEAERLRVKMKAQALQAAHEKAQLENEELARQKAAKEKVDREAAEKVTREKAEQEAAQKARLEAEELAKQKAAKEKADREAAEKAAREKAEKDAVEKARLEAEELARQKAAKEKAAREKVEKETQREVQKIINKNKREIRWEYFKLRIRNWLAKARIYAIPNTLFLIGIAFAVYMFISYSKDIPILNQLLNPVPQPSQISTEIFTPATTFTPPPPTLTFTPASSTKTKTPTLTATVVALQEEIIDDKEITMRLVPAGTFTMGGVGMYDARAEPVHEVFLDAYYMDIYEVTNAAYKLCVVDGTCKPPKESSSRTHPSYFNSSFFYNYPVIYVNWNMANTYCNWRGARLPSEAEWEKAARSTDGRIYPWGDNTADCTKTNRESCNGDNASVGRYEDGKSPYGMYDMAGNVSEWVNDWYDDNYYQSSPSSNPLGPDSGASRVRRGGDWWNYYLGLETFDRDGTVSMSDANWFVGFRCARDANP